LPESISSAAEVQIVELISQLERVLSPLMLARQVLIEKPSTVNTEKLVYTQELELVYIEELVNHSQHK
jgi:hypothetical protein